VSTQARYRPRSRFRRIERWMIGLVMGVLAFGLEKVVARNLRKKGAREKGTLVRGKVDEIDFDPSA
jgi:hypothetical protein